MNRKEFLESKAILKQITKSLKKNPRFEFDYQAVGELKRRVDDYAGLYDFKPYPWQSEFFAASKENKQKCLCAANQVGKSQCGCIEIAYHLTGLYPDNYPGFKFEHPITAWALGYSGEQIRDVVQKKLFGILTREQGFISNSIIPKDLIASEPVRSQTTGLAKDVYVKHVTGKSSVISFKSYSQGHHALMGAIVDCVLIDEEPTDKNIFPQVLTRTANGNKNKGGHTILTFTPENGVTELVDSFMNRRQKGQFFLNVGWDDAPHLDEETKAQLLNSYPSYQRDMRSKGIPALGHGLVFPIDIETIKADYDVPSHWARINGIDFGWDHPTAVVCIAINRDSGMVYVYDCKTWREEVPSVIASGVKKMSPDYVSMSWPHDGLQHDKTSGTTLADNYRDEGINMLSERATWEDGSNSVESGYIKMLDMMRQGMLKISPSCVEIFKEILMFHRKDGKLVKVNDDCLSALRYAIMMIRFADTEPMYGAYNDEDYAETRMGY